MKTTIHLLLIFLLVQQTRAQSFNAFIGQLFGTPQAERQALVDSLLADLPDGRTPIVEDGVAYFIASLEATEIAIAGDMTGWSVDLALSSVSGTNFWFVNFPCPNNTRLDYKFVINDSNWILDPLNPNTVMGGFGPNSELAMPEYLQPQEIEDHGYESPVEIIHDNFYSPQLQNSREIRVLLPPAHDPQHASRVLIVHDGLDYLNLANLEHVLSWMAVHRPGIELPICVCIPAVNRTPEYDGSQRDEFSAFIVDTVIPFIQQNYNCSTAAADWANMGASSGGSISAYLTGTFEQQFSRAILMSPHLPEVVYNAMESRPVEDLRLYLNWGTWDIPLLLPLINSFNSMLDSRAIENTREEYPEGHSWGLWRATIVEGLEAIWPAETALKNDRSVLPESGRLEVWPNPFNGQLHIRVQGPRESGDQIRLFNSRGREIPQPLQKTANGWSWSPHALASGAYWVQLQQKGRIDVLPVLYLK